jgi:branched-chain amino acid transport system substrate-binding protein
MMSRSFGAIAVAVCAALAMTGCGSAAGGGGDSGSTPFRILGVFSLTGAGATFGNAALHALQASADVVNASGGIAGHKIEITWKDDGSNPSQTVSVLQSELNAGTTYNAVSTVTSDQSIPIAPVVMKYPLLMSTDANTVALSDPAKYPRLFSTSYSAQTAESVLAIALADKGYKKVGIVKTSDAYGETNSKSLVDALKGKGVDAYTVSVDRTVPDATAAVQQIMAGSPDAIAMVMTTSGNAGGSVLRARTKLGLSNIPTYTDTGTSTAALTQQTTAADWQNVYEELSATQVAGTDVTTSPAYTAFRTALAKYAETPLKSGIFPYAVKYNSLLVMQAAAKLANSIDPDKLAAAYRALGTTGKVPGYVGKDVALYSDPTTTALAFDPKAFSLVPAGPTVDGLVQPSAAQS